MIKNHTIYMGNCLKIMDLIDDKSIDCIICDLPYGITDCRWDSALPFDELWKQYKRIIKDYCSIVLFASQPFTSRLILSNIDWFKYDLIWKKSKVTGFLNAKNAPLKDYEDIVVFSNGSTASTANKYKNRMKYNPQGLKKIDKIRDRHRRGSDAHRLQRPSTMSGEYVQEFTGYQRMILDFPNVGKTLHPTQKPLTLMDALIRTYSNDGDVVLDNCSGSFSTCVSAELSGRDWIGIEMESQYCEIGKKRLNDASFSLLGRMEAVEIVDLSSL